MIPAELLFAAFASVHIDVAFPDAVVLPLFNWTSYRQIIVHTDRSSYRLNDRLTRRGRVCQWWHLFSHAGCPADRSPYLLPTDRPALPTDRPILPTDRLIFHISDRSSYRTKRPFLTRWALCRHVRVRPPCCCFSCSSRATDRPIDHPAIDHPTFPTDRPTN